MFRISVVVIDVGTRISPGCDFWLLPKLAVWHLKLLKHSEIPVLWPPHVKIWLIGKDSDAGMDWGQEEKGTTEDAMAGWHHWLDGCESEWIPGVGDGQGGLACCDSWGLKESDTTERLNWAELGFLAAKGQKEIKTYIGLYCLLD